MADIGELVVRIKADSAQLKRELANATGAVKGSAAEMEGAVGRLKDQFRELLPVISVVALVEFGKSAFEAADRINDLALRTGFAGSTLSALNIPLKQSGSSVEEFSASVNRMNNLIGEAAKGTNQEAIKAFDALGLSVKKLQTLSPEDQFFAIAEALGKIENQGQMTNAGMAIFGRGFASIIPLIKEAHGDLREFTDAAKGSGDAITDDRLKRIDELGDRWTAAMEKMKLAALEVVPVIEKVAKLAEWVERQHPLDSLAATGIAAGSKLGLIDPDIAQAAMEEAGNIPYGRTPAAKKKSPTAKGSNSALLKGEPDALAADYDTSVLMQYINNLKDEADALKVSREELEIRKGLIEASTKAQQDYTAGLRDTPLLYAEETESIREAIKAKELNKKADEEAIQMAAQMKSAISSSLADIALNFKNFESTLTSVLENIAKLLIQKKITTPLTNSLGDLFDSMDFGKMLGFADGGNPPVGVPSIVGERGPELFIPSTAGTIVPNNKIGGSTVNVYQTIQVNPGVPELINARIRESAPAIASMAHASVFQAIQQGSTEARIVNRRT